MEYLTNIKDQKTMLSAAIASVICGSVLLMGLIFGQEEAWWTALFITSVGTLTALLRITLLED